MVASLANGLVIPDKIVGVKRQARQDGGGRLRQFGLPDEVTSIGHHPASEFQRNLDTTCPEGCGTPFRLGGGELTGFINPPDHKSGGFFYALYDQPILG
jgi:hypothetical protein